MFWAKFSPATREITLVNSEVNFVHWQKNSTSFFWFLSKGNRKCSYKVFPIQFISCCMQMTEGQFQCNCERLVPAVLVENGRGRVGQVHTGQGTRQLSVPSRFCKVEQFHRTAPDCYFKGSDRGLVRRNCTWTCCAEMQQKAYNLGPLLLFWKPFLAWGTQSFLPY